MKNSLFIVGFLFVLLFNACFLKEDPLEKERKEFNKMLNEDVPLTFYKGLKVSIRSIPLNKDYTNLDSLVEKDTKNEVPKHTLYLLKRITEAGKDDGEISIIEGLKIMKAFSDLRKKLSKSDEDEYPTLLEILLFVNQGKSNYELVLDSFRWSKPKEHLLLCGLLLASKPLPASFQLYEASKLQLNKLEKTEIKPIASILKGGSLFKNKWYYLSEEACSEGISSIENEKLQLEYEDFPILFKNTKVETKETQFTQLHAILSLLRGTARAKMEDKDKNELALQDYELFLQDANKLGVDNEFVWYTGAYVNIQKDNNKEAISYLKKLKQSNLTNNKEKEAIAEIIDYLTTREVDKALTAINDKIFIGELIIRQLTSYLQEMELYEKLEESKAGEQFLQIFDVVKDEYNRLNKGLDVNELKEKGKELLKDIF